MQSQEAFKIKPPITSSAAAALRAELEVELQNKKQCAYQPYECTQLTLDGYRYCFKHILQDKAVPFKQCSYVYTSNGKRCQLPAPKGEKKEFGYCNEHALRATLTRNRQNSKYPPPQTAEVLLHSLSHYVKKPRHRTASSSSAQQSDEGEKTVDDGELKVTKSLDPFIDLDAGSLYNSACNEVLDMCSESESDVEASTFASVWHDAHADTSENESIDSDQEDTLKHANVYTAEEITLVTRDKLIRLQSLYIEQYRHLQHMLKEKRRKYLHSLKREKETCCNIYAQVRDNPKEQRLYKKLKAYNKYQRTYGIDAIMNKRLHDLRAKITDGIAPKSHSFTKCTFTEGGVKCGERSLPLAKHCRKHILEDASQVLFRACGKVRADVECSTPVEAIFDDTTCPLHMDIPELRSYNQARKDSESDVDESPESTALHESLALSEHVKTEMLDYSLPTKMETVPSLLFEETPHIMEMDTSILPKLETELETETVEPTLQDIQMEIDEFPQEFSEPVPGTSGIKMEAEKFELSESEVKTEEIFEAQEAINHFESEVKTEEILAAPEAVGDFENELKTEDILAAPEAAGNLHKLLEETIIANESVVEDKTDVANKCVEIPEVVKVTEIVKQEILANNNAENVNSEGTEKCGVIEETKLTEENMCSLTEESVVSQEITTTENTEKSLVEVPEESNKKDDVPKEMQES